MQLLERIPILRGSLPPIPVHRFEGRDITQHDIKDLWLPSYSLDDAERVLDKIFSTEPPIDVRERLVHHLGETAQLGRLIENVMTDPYRLRQVADKSELHPLGFDKIPLLSSGEYQLRLNIWRDAKHSPPWTGGEDRHKHRFGFSSHVKLGEIATWVYEITDEQPPRYLSILNALDANEPDELTRTLAWYDKQDSRRRKGLFEEHLPEPVTVFEADHQSGNEAMRLLGSTHAKLVDSHITRAGSTYSLSPDTCHTAHQVDSTKTTATVFLRGNFTDKPDVIAKSNKRYTAEQADSGQANISRPKVRFTTEQVKRKLGDLMDLVLQEAA
jgi:hypothetical protein